MGKLLLIVGILGLCHAAYSAAQHRTYLRLTEQNFSNLPIDIVLQTLVSLLICALGLLQIGGTFRQIKVTSDWENKTWDNIASRQSFYSFNHRGKYLHTENY
jgi:membrane magnesium transporter 1